LFLSTYLALLVKLAKVNLIFSANQLVVPTVVLLVEQTVSGLKQSVLSLKQLVLGVKHSDKHVV